jgi:hypothetical protein
MLDPIFLRRLETDSRTTWARHIDEEQLAGLIWALGDFSVRGCFLTELLDDHRAEIDPADTDFARARALLQRLSDLVNTWRSSALPGQLIADAIGPQPFWASRTRSMITGEFRRRLEETKGKYFRWALNLTEDHHFAILATIGELAPLTYPIVAQLDRHQAKVFARVAYARARTALEIITEMARGTRYTYDDVHGRIYLAIRKAEEPSHRPDNWVQWTD